MRVMLSTVPSTVTEIGSVEDGDWLGGDIGPTNQAQISDHRGA